KRSIAAASALRAEGRVTSRWLSSSLASPVRAMCVLLGGGGGGPLSAVRRSAVCLSAVHGAVVVRLDVAVGVIEQITVRRGEAHRVVVGLAVAHADLAQQGADPAVLSGLGEFEGVGDAGRVGDQRVEAAVARALEVDVELYHACPALRFLYYDGQVWGVA